MRKTITSLSFAGKKLLLAIALSIVSIGANSQNAVKVGNGSYAEYTPLSEASRPFVSGSAGWGDQSQKMMNRLTYVVDTNTRAIPTNDWWTDLIFSKFSGDMWAYPQVVSAKDYGIYVKFPKTWSVDGTALESKSQIDIKGVNFAPISAVARRWSDWAFDFLMKESDSKYMAVTLGHGLPATWVEFTGVTPVISATATSYFNDAGAAITFPYTGDHFGIVVNGDHYGVYAPDNTNFTLSSSNITVNFAGTQKFLVIVPLPAANNLATFYTYAYAIPRDTKLSWAYNNTTGKISTTWTLTTQNLKGQANLDVIQGWIPHHYKKSTPGFSFNSITYQTPRGLMKCATGRSFTITYNFNGILPNMPAPDNTTGANPYIPANMKTMIDNYSGKAGYGGDTYWGGKDLVYMGQYMMFAKETGNTTAFETIKKNLRSALEDWYTYTPGEPEHFFSYYPNMKSLVGVNASYGSDEFNDHHFHYGYYTYATAMLGFFDKDFIGKYGDMAKMVAKDYANWDRTDSRLPFLRNFDTWGGHSWAGGVGDALNGNGQESSSEAMQGWSGLYMLGVSTGDNAMRDAGIMGYTMEARATAEYWFDRDHIPANGGVGNYDYTKYTKPYNSNITGRGIGWWTWFSGDPVWMHSIQWLPISPGLKYLYEDQNFAKWDYAQMWAKKELGGWDTNLGNESGIGNVCLSYLQIGNPDTAAIVWDYLWNNNKATAKDNYTGGISYYYINSHRSLGEIQWDKFTNIPTSTVYYNSKTGRNTYVVYNPASTEQTCTVYNTSGTVITSFKVPANKMIAHHGDAVLSSITITSPAITVQSGGTLQFTANRFDQYGATSTGTITWTVSGGGSISATGLFSATTNGTFTVTAKSGTITATKSVRVGTAPVLTTITVAPATTSTEIGSTVQYTATAVDQYGDPFTITPTWTASAGGTISSTGLFTATAYSTSSTITATAGGKTGTTTLSINYPLANIALGKPAFTSNEENYGTPVTYVNDGNVGTRWSTVPADPQWVYIDLQAKFNIYKVKLNWEAAYAKAYTIEVSDNGTTWLTVYTQANGGGGIETINLNTAGRYVRMTGTQRASTFGYSLWEFEVYGKVQAGTGTTLTSIIVSPSVGLIKQNETQAFTAKGYDQNGGLMTITPTWSVLGTGSISASGVYTPTDSTSGSVIIVAKSGIINGTALANVEQVRKLSSLTVTPNTTQTSRFSVAVGMAQQFVASGTDQFNLPFAANLTWSVSGGGTVTQDGFFKPTAAGDYMVFAKSGLFSDTAFVSVRNLVDVNVALGKPVVVSASENAEMDGSKAVDGSVGTRWSSPFTADHYLYVDLKNTYTLNRIVMKWEGAFATKYNIQVSLDGTTWTPAFTQNAGTGGTETVNITNSARFVRINCTERAIAAYGYSLYEFEVYASSMSATTTLSALKLSPSVTRVNNGSTQQFTASGLDQNGNAMATAISYSTTGGGSINASGLFTASRVGTFQIYATSGSITKTAIISVDPASTIVNPVLTTITLSPASASVNVGQTQQFTASGKDQNGNAFAISPTWTISGTGNAISASGLVTASTAGTFTVTATQGAVSGTASITISNTSTNIALNKPTSVSSTENAGTPGSSAVDGNAGTRWSSLAADPQSIMIDLQATYNINKVVLNWETAAAKAYQIQVSADNVTWTNIYTATAATGGVETLNISGTGRYIRMYGTARTTVWGYSLWEFEVYGTPSGNIAVTGVTMSPATVSIATTATSQLTATVAPSNATNKTVSYVSSNTAVATVNATGLVTGIAAGTANITVTTQDGAKTAICAVTVTSNNTNLALNKPATTSSYEGLFTANMANDGDAGTRWSSLFTDPQWIMIDLQASYNISKVVLNWETAAGKSYQIQVSADGVNWSNIYTTSTGVGGLETLNITGTGRYIRMNGTARTTVYGYSLWEFEVYGSALKSVREATEVAHLAENAITYYPNPVKDKLTINLGENNQYSLVSIFDLTGKMVKQLPLGKVTNNSEIDMSNLNAGTYIIRMTGISSVNSFKILKK